MCDNDDLRNLLNRLKKNQRNPIYENDTVREDDYLNIFDTDVELWRKNEEAEYFAEMTNKKDYTKIPGKENGQRITKKKNGNSSGYTMLIADNAGLNNLPKLSVKNQWKGKKAQEVIKQKTINSSDCQKFCADHSKLGDPPKRPINSEASVKKRQGITMKKKVSNNGCTKLGLEQAGLNRSPKTPVNNKESVKKEQGIKRKKNSIECARQNDPPKKSVSNQEGLKDPPKPSVNKQEGAKKGQGIKKKKKINSSGCTMSCADHAELSGPPKTKFNSQKNLKKRQVIKKKKKINSSECTMLYADHAGLNEPPKPLSQIGNNQMAYNDEATVDVVRHEFFKYQMILSDICLQGPSSKKPCMKSKNTAFKPTPSSGDRPSIHVLRSLAFLGDRPSFDVQSKEPKKIISFSQESKKAGCEGSKTLSSSKKPCMELKNTVLKPTPSTGGRPSVHILRSLALGDQPSFNVQSKVPRKKISVSIKSKPAGCENSKTKKPWGKINGSQKCKQVIKKAFKTLSSNKKPHMKSKNTVSKPSYTESKDSLSKIDPLSVDRLSVDILRSLASLGDQPLLNDKAKKPNEISSSQRSKKVDKHFKTSSSPSLDSLWSLAALGDRPTALAYAKDSRSTTGSIVENKYSVCKTAKFYSSEMTVVKEMKPIQATNSTLGIISNSDNVEKCSENNCIVEDHPHVLRSSSSLVDQQSIGTAKDTVTVTSDDVQKKKESGHKGKSKSKTNCLIEDSLLSSDSPVIQKSISTLEDFVAVTSDDIQRKNESESCNKHSLSTVELVSHFVPDDGKTQDYIIEDDDDTSSLKCASVVGLRSEGPSNYPSEDSLSSDSSTIRKSKNETKCLFKDCPADLRSRDSLVDQQLVDISGDSVAVSSNDAQRNKDYENHNTHSPSTEDDCISLAASDDFKIVDDTVKIADIGSPMQSNCIRSLTLGDQPPCEVQSKDSMSEIYPPSGDLLPTDIFKTLAVLGDRPSFNVQSKETSNKITLHKRKKAGDGDANISSKGRPSLRSLWSLASLGDRPTAMGYAKNGKSIAAIAEGNKELSNNENSHSVLENCLTEERSSDLRLNDSLLDQQSVAEDSDTVTLSDDDDDISYRRGSSSKRRRMESKNSVSKPATSSRERSSSNILRSLALLGDRPSFNVQSIEPSEINSSQKSKQANDEDSQSSCPSLDSSFLSDHQSSKFQKRKQASDENSQSSCTSLDSSFSSSDHQSSNIFGSHATFVDRQSKKLIKTKDSVSESYPPSGDHLPVDIFKTLAVLGDRPSFNVQSKETSKKIASHKRKKAGDEDSNTSSKVCPSLRSLWSLAALGDRPTAMSCAKDGKSIAARAEDNKDFDCENSELSNSENSRLILENCLTEERSSDLRLNDSLLDQQSDAEDSDIVISDDDDDVSHKRGSSSRRPRMESKKSVCKPATSSSNILRSLALLGDRPSFNVQSEKPSEPKDSVSEFYPSSGDRLPVDIFKSLAVLDERLTLKVQPKVSQKISFQKRKKAGGKDSNTSSKDRASLHTLWSLAALGDRPTAIAYAKDGESIAASAENNKDSNCETSKLSNSESSQSLLENNLAVSVINQKNMLETSDEVACDNHKIEASNIIVHLPKDRPAADILKVLASLDDCQVIGSDRATNITQGYISDRDSAGKSKNETNCLAEDRPSYLRSSNSFVQQSVAEDSAAAISDDDDISYYCRGSSSKKPRMESKNSVSKPAISSRDRPSSNIFRSLALLGDRASFKAKPMKPSEVISSQISKQADDEESQSRRSSLNGTLFASGDRPSIDALRSIAMLGDRPSFNVQSKESSKKINSQNWKKGNDEDFNTSSKSRSSLHSYWSHAAHGDRPTAMAYIKDGKSITTSTKGNEDSNYTGAKLFNNKNSLSVLENTPSNMSIFDQKTVKLRNFDKVASSSYEKEISYRTNHSSNDRPAEKMTIIPTRGNFQMFNAHNDRRTPSMHLQSGQFASDLTRDHPQMTSVQDYDDQQMNIAQLESGQFDNARFNPQMRNVPDYSVRQMASSQLQSGQLESVQVRHDRLSDRQMASSQLQSGQLKSVQVRHDRLSDRQTASEQSDQLTSFQSRNNSQMVSAQVYSDHKMNNAQFENDQLASGDARFNRQLPSVQGYWAHQMTSSQLQSGQLASVQTQVDRQMADVQGYSNRQMTSSQLQSGQLINAQALGVPKMAYVQGYCDRQVTSAHSGQMASIQARDNREIPSSQLQSGQLAGVQTQVDRQMTDVQGYSNRQMTSSQLQSGQLINVQALGVPKMAYVQGYCDRQVTSSQLQSGQMASVQARDNREIPSSQLQSGQLTGDQTQVDRQMADVQGYSNRQMTSSQLQSGQLVNAQVLGVPKTAYVQGYCDRQVTGAQLQSGQMASVQARDNREMANDHVLGYYQTANSQVQYINAASDGYQGYSKALPSPSTSGHAVNNLASKVYQMMTSSKINIPDLSHRKRAYNELPKTTINNSSGVQDFASKECTMSDSKFNELTTTTTTTTTTTPCSTQDTVNVEKGTFYQTISEDKPCSSARSHVLLDNHQVVNTSVPLQMSGVVPSGYLENKESCIEASQTLPLETGDAHRSAIVYGHTHRGQLNDYRVKPSNSWMNTSSNTKYRKNIATGAKSSTFSLSGYYHRLVAASETHQTASASAKNFNSITKGSWRKG